MSTRQSLQQAIDFRELSNGGEGLEGLIFLLAERLGLYPEWSGRGTDGGRDLYLAQMLSKPLKVRIRWLVSCKDYATSGNSVPPSDLPNPFDSTLRRHSAQGFLLVTTTTASTNTKSLLDAEADERRFFTEVWNQHRLRELLLNPANEDLLRQFLPQSYARIHALEGAPTDNIARLVERFASFTQYQSRKPLLSGMTEPLPRDEVGHIEDHLEARGLVLVTGESGSGKSGIAFALCTPRADPSMSVLLLDARRYSNVRDIGSLSDEIDLRDPIAACIERIGQRVGCRLIIDQLDSTSVEAAGQVFIRLALLCSKLSGVQVVVLSRRRESYERRMLGQLTEAGFTELECGDLTDAVARDALNRIGIADPLDDLTALSKNLLNLSLVARIRTEQPTYDFTSVLNETALWEGFIDALRSSEEHHTSQGADFGERVIVEAIRLACESMQAEDRTAALEAVKTMEQRRLESWGVIVPEEGNRCRFYHEKLQDFLYARYAVEHQYLPDKVMAELTEHRTRNVLSWMVKLYRRSHSPRLAEFLQGRSMSNPRVPFYTQAAILDEFIHTTDPAADPLTVDIILQAIRTHAELRDYFFRNRPSLGWLPVLWDHGFFDHPPSPVPSEQGFLLPRWDVQEYLASVAAQAPDLVLRHIATIDAHPVYIARAVACLIQLPLDHVEETIPRVITWLSDLEMAIHLRYVIEGLIKALAQDGRESALDLFEAFIRPFPNLDATHENRYLKKSDAISIIGKHRFQDAEFLAIVKALSKINHQGLINVLEGALLLALRLEAAESQAHGVRSTWWRSAIERSGQNWHHQYKDDLVDALRDACERWVDEDTASARVIVERYLSTEEEPILRRLGLHLLHISHGAFSDLVTRELLEQANYDEAEIHHEFMCLIEEGYQFLTEEDKRRVLGNIQAGPPKDRVEDLAVWATTRQEDNRENALSKEEYIQSYTRYWKLNRFWMIRDHLSGTLLSELQSLVAERGEPDHPTFLSWSSGVFSISEVSPLTTEQIATLAPDQLLTLLREWEPVAEQAIGPKHISREGFGAVVADLIVQNITASQSYLNKLCLIHPVYTSAIVRRLAQAAKQGAFTPSDWLACVGLCEELLRHEEVRVSMERLRNVDWRDVRKDIVDLLEATIDKKDSSFSPELLPRVRDLLILLLNDPDPDRSDDRPAEGWLGHGDPHTVALNHVRPAALSTLIQYASHVVDQAPDQQIGVEPARLDTNVRTALSMALHDSSLAVHSVYGRYLMHLYRLDSDWLIDHLSDIFPEEDTEEAISMYVAAWDAYVIFNQQLYPALYRKLYSYYERAIENLKRGYVTKTHLQPIEGLAAHLIFFYVNDIEKEKQVESSMPLLHRFFQEAGSEERGQAAWVLWRGCKDLAEAGESSDAWWPKARAIWQHRVESAASQNFPSNFDQEMGWFSMLLDIAPADETLSTLWPLLQGTLPYVATTGFRHQVWESFEKFVARQVETDPIRSIELYTQMYDRSPSAPWLDREERRRILAISASQPESRRKALALLDTMARRGDMRLRDIYERYAL